MNTDIRRKRGNRYSRGEARTQVMPDENDATLLYRILNLRFVRVAAVILLRLLGSRTSTRHTYNWAHRYHAAGYLTRLPRYTSPAMAQGSKHDLLMVETGRAGVQADAKTFYADMTKAEQTKWENIAKADSERIRNLLAKYGYDVDAVKRRMRQNADDAEKVLMSSWNTSEHTILTSDFVAILAHAVVSCGLAIKEIYGDGQVNIKTEVTVDGKKQWLYRKPDAVVVVRQGDVTPTEADPLDVFIIETETGTASRKKVTEKIRTYMAMLEACGTYDDFRLLVARAAFLPPNAVRSVRVVVYSQTDVHHKMVCEVVGSLSPDSKAGMFYMLPASKVNLNLPTDIMRKNRVIPGVGERPTDYYRTVLHGDVADVVYGQKKVNGGTREKPNVTVSTDARPGPLLYYPIPGLESQEPEASETAA